MSAAQDKLSTFPAFFRVSGRTVVVVGEGDEAFAKARLLFNTDARIVVLAETPEADFARFIAEKDLVLVRAPFSKDAILGATLVFAVDIRIENNEGGLKNGFPADVYIRWDSSAPWPARPPW